jgi:hypothetical protein
MVTGKVPEDVKVTGCVAGLFNVTEPNATLVALMLSNVVAVFNCREKLFETLPWLAVSVAAWEVPTDDTVAVNPALVALAGTVIDDGNVTTEELLDRLIARPPLGAAAVSVTVQPSVPDPVMDALVQESALSAAAEVPVVPVPLRLTTVVPLVELLLVMVNCPVTDPAAVGSNTTARVDACPGFKVMGSVAPETVKPVPASATALMVKGRPPVDVKVTDFATGVFKVSLPKAKLVVLTLSVCIAASNCRAKALETVPWLAVRVTACDVQFHHETVAMKEALVAPPGTVTEDGNVTAALLLNRFTVSPPLGAAALNTTVQGSCTHPVSDDWLHVIAFSAAVCAPGVPVPVRLIKLV